MEGDTQPAQCPEQGQQDAAVCNSESDAMVSDMALRELRLENNELRERVSHMEAAREQESAQCVKRMAQLEHREFEVWQCHVQSCVLWPFRRQTLVGAKRATRMTKRACKAFAAACRRLLSTIHIL